MFVGRRSHPFIQQKYQDQSKETIRYALDQIKNSQLAPFIQAIYLYGSCARKEQSFVSDVDLFAELTPDFDIKKYKKELVELKGSISPTNYHLPEVDLHVVIGDEWKESKDLYYQNIRREGAKIWEKQ